MDQYRLRFLVPFWIIALLASFSALLTGTAAQAATAVGSTVRVDGTHPGRTFDGVGAISGGGGNSRLLMDYPEPYRSQVLDYLFKPGYGADLQILKVEIGGDTNSTDGAESSHEHVKGDLDCNRGYEWWLIDQAKQRNPGIKLYGLAWGAPGWLGGGDFWSQDTVNYLTDWIGCAKETHHVTIDYLGGWNERGYNVGWYESLHAALAAHGYPAKVVGADSGWEIADQMVKDPAFAASVDIIGTHYPCGYESAMTSCSTTQNALSTGKQLWASENGSEDYNAGGAPMARAINRGYLDAKMTSYLNWPLVASVYPNLPYATTALMVADQPWSGAFSVGKQLWASAHTTQFTQPGWQYIDSASGYLRGDRANGSYVTMQAPGHSAYSTVIETMDATAPQTYTFSVTGGLPGGAVHVWDSNFDSSAQGDYLNHTTDLAVSGGSYSLTLQPHHLYTLTTTTGQGRGDAASPPRAALALPYADSFATTAPGHEPRYLAQQQGAFEAAPCGGGRSGTCVRQQAAQQPIEWDGAADPYTLIGDLGWGDYTVTVDVLLEQTGAVQLMGRVGTQRGFNVSGINAYYLQLDDRGGWKIVKNDTSGTLTTLAGGSTAALGTNTWHRASISFQASTITASLDGARLGSATDGSYRTGQAGLGVNGYRTEEFGNLSLTPIGAPAAGTAYKLVNRNSSQLLAVSGGSTADQAPVVQAADDGSAGSQWELSADGSGYLTLRNATSGKVLDVPGGSTGQGVQLDQATASGADVQQWQVQPTGDGYFTLVNHHSGQLADVSQAGTAPGAAVVQWPPTGAASQQWRLVQVPVTGRTYELVNANSGLVMDVNGGSTADGAPIIQWPDHGGTNQQWTLAGDSAGWTLTNVNSGKLLEVPGGSTAQNTQLDQAARTGATSQQWRLTALPDDTYTLVNVNSGLDADAANRSTTQGTAVIQWADNGGSNQHWILRH